MRRKEQRMSQSPDDEPIDAEVVDEGSVQEGGAVAVPEPLAPTARVLPADRSCTQYSTIPIWYSHNSSGSSGRSKGSIFALDPSTTSWRMLMAASRAGADSGENGLSGLAGSAAFRKN